MISLFILAFVSGVLTVAAPCILPLLPVIVGGTATTETKEKTWFRPLVIAASLAVSVVVFTLLLKATTALLGIPQYVWNAISGGIVLLFGLNLLFPLIWERAMATSGFYKKSNQLLGAAYKQHGLARDILLGAALGPVFSSCSPTYALIVATLLPLSFTAGLAMLGAYAAGLAAILLIIGVMGRAAVQKLGWLSRPDGWFKRVLGVLFIAVGFAVMFGLDRSFQAYVLEQGWYDPILKLEQNLHK